VPASNSPGVTHEVSRRGLLKGLVAGSAALALPAYAAGSGVLTPSSDLRRPDSRPFPQRPAGTDMIPQIDHVVVLMMENHSFDSYFGMLGRGDGFTLGPDGQPTAVNDDASGHPVSAYHAPSTCQAHYDVSQSWTASHTAWDYGRMDGFVRGTSADAMAYWTGADLPFYYSLGRTFPLCDRYFASTMAQTYPNRRFLMAGTALGQVSDPLPGPLDPAPPNGTIFDRLNAYGISWKDYFVDLATCMLFPSVPEHNPQHLAPVAEFFVDAAAGTLPGFCIVDTEFNEASEENPQDIQTGEEFAARVINAVMTGAAWERTLLIWTYDEHGGYYDHVPPPPAVRPDGIAPQVTQTYGDLYSYYGMRVPTVVVSPYARPNHVSHTVYDHTSILKLVETKWNLPALTFRDANANDMLDTVDLRRRPAFLDPPTLAAPATPTGAAACYLQDPTVPGA
jgi:phospholipase C